MNDDQAAAFLRNPFANAAVALRQWEVTRPRSPACVFLTRPVSSHTPGCTARLVTVGLAVITSRLFRTTSRPPGLQTFQSGVRGYSNTF